MTRNGVHLTVTQVPTLAWPLEESTRWSIGSGLAKRRLSAKTRRRAREAVVADAAARSERRAEAIVQPTEYGEYDGGEHAHDGAMSRASGWFLMPPSG